MARSALVRFLVCSAILAALALSTSTRGHADIRGRDPDKARLISIGDSPDPVNFPGQVCNLSAAVGVRKVDGLGSRGNDDADDCDDDRNGRRDHEKRFYLRVYWTLSTSAGPRLIQREIEVKEPFQTRKIRTSRGNKTFVIAPVELQWDGRDSAGNLVTAASYSYEVYADFIRVHDHGSGPGRVEKVKIIDTTATLAGTITVRRDAGGGPSLTVTQPASGFTTKSATVTVAGTVSGDEPLSVTVNGTSAPIDSGAFSLSVPISIGQTTLTIVATDGQGRTAQEARTVTREATQPTLVVSSPANGAVTKETSVTVSGTVSGEAPLSVTVNGTNAPIDAGAFSLAISIPEGQTTLTIVATDGFGGTLQVIRTVTRDSANPLITISSPASGSTTSDATPDFVINYSRPLTRLGWSTFQGIACIRMRCCTIIISLKLSGRSLCLNRSMPEKGRRQFGIQDRLLELTSPGILPGNRRGGAEPHS